MNSRENWDLQVDPAVFKFLKKIPKGYVAAILEVIKFLPANPYFGDIQKMKGGGEVWRRRVGAYRIFYKVKTSEKVILVFSVERRGSKIY